MKEKKKKSPTSKRSETGILSRCIPCSYWMSQWGQRGQQGRLPGTHTDASLAHAWLPVEQVSCLGSISTSEALESDSARITTRGRDPQPPDPPLTHRRLQTCCHRAPEAGGQVRRKKCGAKRSQSFPIPSGFPHLVSREGLVFGWMLQLCLTFKLPSALGG